MSVLCSQTPAFLLQLALRAQPGFADRPLALLGPEERLWAVSPQAQHCGVQLAMRPQAARLLCPDLLLHPVDLAAAQAAQAGLLTALADWGLPVEPLGWGAAYVDLHGVAGQRATVQPLATAMGQRLRRTLGDALQPALGWDSGKFTARAAALQTPPGRVRLVGKEDEARFLRPLPITLLPLPHHHVQQLHWLGILTLGQFADLPAAAVWQRFGAAGKTAHQWAQGHDPRPVRAGAASPPPATTVSLDPPAGRLQPVVDAVMASLTPQLAALAAGLEGVRRLLIVLNFTAGAERADELTFVEPASQPARIQAGLVQRLSTQPWPAPVQAVRWTLLERGELAVQQLTLFQTPVPHLIPLAAVARKLTTAAGAFCFQAQVHDAHHPAAERRGRFAAVVND